MGLMKTTKLFVLTVLSVAVLSLAACGGGGQQSGVPPEGNGAEQASSSGEGSEDFSVTTLEGERFDLSESRGEVVALYFMAGW
jgi:cytochrome oxidase Cu insertion factor (SCO1/SenC/PrrC family)